MERAAVDIAAGGEVIVAASWWGCVLWLGCVLWCAWHGRWLNVAIPWAGTGAVVVALVPLVLFVVVATRHSGHLPNLGASYVWVYLEGESIARRCAEERKKEEDELR